MADPKKSDERGFRALLVLGAIVSIAIGLSGLLFTGMLESVLGFDVPNRGVDAFTGVARLYGGTMLALGIGYALAAAQPQRSRSLLVMLFAAPALAGITAIASAARGEMAGGRGIVFAVYNVAYCLLYFRVYPRVRDRPGRPQPPPSTPKNLAP